MELMKASNQWMSRPSDERFTSLITMQDHFNTQRKISHERVVASTDLTWTPDAVNDPLKGLLVAGKQGALTAPTHYAFGQACQRIGAPAKYLRSLPAPMAADCLNYGFKHQRDVEDVGVLLRINGSRTMDAVTGPNYGRVWNGDIVDSLVERFGDGRSGHWRVPGEFGHRVDVTKANTTLFAGDRDMFVFLADEDRRITVANRRNGKGSMARGFFVWNSEVGASTFGVAMFLFDYVCCNRIVWGAEGYKEIRVRHTASGPARLVADVLPAIKAMSESSAAPIEATIKAAQQRKIDGVSAFLLNRFTTAELTGAQLAFTNDEGRQMITEDRATIFDMVTGMTAHARSIVHQDERVKLERKAGALLDLVKA